MSRMVGCNMVDWEENDGRIYGNKRAADESRREIVNPQMTDRQEADSQMADRQETDRRMADRQATDQRMAGRQETDRRMAGRQATDQRMAGRQGADRRMAGRQKGGRAEDAGYTIRGNRMQPEEIAREREASGWNPYEGEEERTWSQDFGENAGDRRLALNEGHTEQLHLPYFQMPDYTQILEEQRMTERDLRMLQSMYPEVAKRILPMVGEECDKMEYEGSMMFDERPDPTTIQILEDRIYEQVKDQLPWEPEEQPDELLTMQYPGHRRRRPGRNWGRDMIRILLLDEIHHRRCRHSKCRRPY